MHSAAIRRYRIVSEPRGAAYEGLLHFCSAIAQRCSLEEYKTRAAKDFLEKIDAFCVGRVARDNVFKKFREDTIAVRLYSVTPELAAALAEAVPGLYGWHRPKLPANLKFYRDRDGDAPLLETTAQLRLGWLHLTDAEAQSALLCGVELHSAP